MLKNLGWLPVSAAYMPIENERILVQCKYIKKNMYYWALTCFMEWKIWWLDAYKYYNGAKSQTSEACHQ